LQPEDGQEQAGVVFDLPDGGGDLGVSGLATPERSDTEHMTRDRSIAGFLVVADEDLTGEDMKKS
jgi:hypothetical protein